MSRVRCVALVAATGLLAGCSHHPGNPRLTHDATTLNRGNGSEIASLDPHYITGDWESYVVGDCLIGLTTEDGNGDPIPGAALRWETSADGKTWTFHMRDHVWSDGVPVTAQDFVYAWRRILEPARGAPYAYYLWLVKNAQAVSTGKASGAALGIQALDDETLVVTLTHPAPYLPEWLMHQTTYPVPRHVLLAKGDAWAKPENYVGNGPYLPKRWIPNDHLTLVKNQKFYDARQVRIETVNYYATADTQAALKQLVAGQLDTQELIPTTEIDWLRKNMADALVLRPNFSTSYIIINFNRPAFHEKRLREAMSLAYDRESVVTKILKLGEPPAYAFVPPGTANYPLGASLDFTAMPYADRIAKARALMAELGYGPDKHFRTSYLTTVQPDAKRLAAAFQSFMRAIYIDIDVVQIDPSVFYETLAQHNFDLAASTWIGDFNDASTFLDLLRTGAGNNYGSYSNRAFDAFYARAEQEPDGDKRGTLMADSEKVALGDDAVIPVRFRFTQNLVEPYVKGWVTNRANIRNVHHTRWLSIDPKAAGQ